MNDSTLEQKQLRLKQFLKMLSEDPSLLHQDGAMQSQSRSLSELLLISGYPSRNESIDMAELVSLLLKRLGMEAGSEEMMEHVMNGGTVDEFIDAWR